MLEFVQNGVGKLFSYPALHIVPSQAWHYFMLFLLIVQYFAFMQVSRDAGRRYAHELNALFIETSAKTAQNVDEMLAEIGNYSII